MKLIRKGLSIILTLIIVAGVLAGCSPAKTENIETEKDFSKAKIGVLTGSSFDSLVKENYPEAERLSYMNMPDLILTLKQGKIDGILMDKGFFTPLVWEGEKLSYIEMDMPATEFAVAFPKDEKFDYLKSQMNVFIKEQTENGWIEELKTKWLSYKEPDGKVDFSSLKGENGTLRIATTTESRPFDYLKDGQFCGFDADFIYRFAEKYGYALEIDTIDFGALLLSISAGRYDLAISSITVTEERKENINFSDKYCGSDIVMAVLDEDEASEPTFADIENATLGIVTGTSLDIIAQEKFPNAERKYFGSTTDAILALEQGKVDAIFEDRTVYIGSRWESTNIYAIDEPIETVQNALILAKEGYDENLLNQLNTFIAKINSDGTLAKLKEKWFSEKEPTEHPDYTNLTGENGTLKIAIGDSMKPVSYQRGTLFTGFEVEFLTLFAEEYGYKLDMQGMAFDALIPSVASGKCDIGASGITITPERTESVTFTDSHFETDVLVVMNGEAEVAPKTTPKYKSPDEFKDGTLGILTGTIWDEVAKEEFPDCELKYYSSITDMILSLEQDKIDALLGDNTYYVSAAWEDAPVTMLDERIGSISCGLILAKDNYDEDLLEELNAFIAKAKSDGTMAALEEKWFADDEPEDLLDCSNLTGEKGTLKVAVGNSLKPMTYQKNDSFTGLDVEFMIKFAEEYGYGLEFVGMDFDALIPTVATNKCDIGICGIGITPERAESVTYTDAYVDIYGILIVSEVGGETGAGGNAKKTLADFKNSTIGILTGSVYETFAKEGFPDAKREYYSMISDMLVAVEQGKIDGYMSESTYVTAAIWEGAKIQAVDEAIDHTQAGFIFQKGEASAKLREQMNSFIRSAKENGTLDELNKKWFGKTEPSGTLDYDSLTGENGTIRVAVAPDLKPISYIKEGELAGYEMELMLLFAKEYGYKLEIDYMTFDAILPGVTTGKYDIGTGAFTITEERSQSIDFSDSHLTVDVVMVVKAEPDAIEEPSFFDEFKEDFQKTFIREDRWKLIAEGIGVTMLISVCAAIAGSLLGFGLYMLTRSDIKILQLLAKKIAKVYSRIIAGTPVVVILMILFYVIFGSFRDMSGILVAIIGFTLTFGAFVYSHMEVSVNSVDFGQTEAAYAIGYPKNKAFFRIIFPQAMTVFMPSYCSQAVELVKATAVVGYIAVNDLTKMGDIIRSNTYEAFFPLIATAVIYFILTWILSILLGFVKVRFEPKRRSKEDILKGVKTV